MQMTNQMNAFTPVSESTVAPQTETTAKFIMKPLKESGQKCYEMCANNEVTTILD